MNIRPAEFCATGVGFPDGEITCPACRKVWGTVELGVHSLQPDTACPHLKFYVENAGGDLELRYINNFTVTELMAAVETAGRLITPDLYGKSVEQFFALQLSENEFWAKLECPSLDTILLHVDSDGDASEQSYNYTVHFGACLQ